MRIRTIKPEFWTSDDITSLPYFTRLLFIGLWSYVDDNGVGRDEEHLIASTLFPADLYRSFTECSGNVHGALQQLFHAGLIARYEVDGKRFLQVINWKKHQKINRPQDGRFPQYSNENATSLNVHGTLTECSLPGTEEQGNRGTEDITPFSPPTDDGGAHTPNASTASRKRSAKTTGTRLPDDWTPSADLQAWTVSNCPNLPADTLDRFRDYWHGVAGAKGRKADWDATWRNWARRTHEETVRRGGPNQTQVLDEMRARAYQATATQGDALRLIEMGDIA